MTLVLVIEGEVQGRGVICCVLGESQEEDFALELQAVVDGGTEITGDTGVDGVWVCMWLDEHLVQCLGVVDTALEEELHLEVGASGFDFVQVGFELVGTVCVKEDDDQHLPNSDWQSFPQ